MHHRKIAEEAAEFFDTLYIVPCGRRQDKSSSGQISDLDRCNLVRFNFEGLKLELDFSDITDGLFAKYFTPTWKLQERYSEKGEIWHIIGPDLIEGGADGRSEIHRIWERGPEIWQTLNYAIIKPENCSIREADLPPNSIMIPVSKIIGRSSEIRELISTGQSFDHSLMPKAEAYIKARSLYGYKNQ